MLESQRVTEWRVKRKHQPHNFYNYIIYFLGCLGNIFFPIDFDIPSGSLLPNSTFYSRFRLFDTEPVIPSLAFSGRHDNGEVEDYGFQYNTQRTITTNLFIPYKLRNKN